MDGRCCADQGGVAEAVGSTCAGACCSATGACTDSLEENCVGVFGGINTTCAAGTCAGNWQCCNNTTHPAPDACDNHPIDVCVAEGGTPRFGSSCDDTNPARDRDNDGVLNDCDNCPDTWNPVNPLGGFDCNGDNVVGGTGTGEGPYEQCNEDGDTFGDACDLCPNDVSTNADADGDGFGDECDHCPNMATVANFDWDEDGVGDDCDNCPLKKNAGQENCDMASEDPSNYIGDACDPDIDEDGVLNDDDRCDFSPLGSSGLTGFVGPSQPSSPFLGTFRADMDGDCDVDQADIDLIQMTPDVSCVNGTSKEEADLCGQGAKPSPFNGGGFGSK